MNNIGIPTPKTTALLVVDVQERLMPVIDAKEGVFANVNKLLRGAEILSLPVLVTEQYPKGLGHTCQEVQLPVNQPIIEKICFSCMQSTPVLQQLNEKGITDVILCGVEAHICVLKTALEALQHRYNVHVVADAVSSRTPENKHLALERLRQSGAYIVSTEMILFMLLHEAGTDAFKAISKLIK